MLRSPDGKWVVLAETRREVDPLSYDLYLVKPAPGQDALAYARTWFTRDADDDMTPTPERAQEMRRLADALHAAFPELATEQADAEHIEVYGPDETGVTIAFYADETAISIPYWRQQEGATAVMEQVGHYVALLQREAGYVTYDPQRGELFAPQGDAGEAAHRLNDVTARLPDIVASIQRDHHD